MIHPHARGDDRSNWIADVAERYAARVRAWPLVLLLVGGCAVPTPTPARPLAVPPTPAVAVALTTPTSAAPAPQPPTAPPPIPAALATLAPTRPPPTATADRGRGIELGKPVALVSEGARVVGVLATNTTEVVKTFTVRATYTQDGRPVATAAGAVNDLLPGQTRAALLASTDQIPTGAQSVRLDVGSVVDKAATTPGARAAGLIRFGAARALPSPTLPTVELDVTNGDQAAHTLTVQAALLRGDELVGVAVGSVNDLAPGATKTASLTVQGTTEGHDRVLPAVQTIVR
jgi:hypothetical protein